MAILQHGPKLRHDPPRCKLERRFEHIKAMLQTCDLQKIGLNLNEDLFFALHLILGTKLYWFREEQFLTLFFSQIFWSSCPPPPPPPPVSKSCVRYWLELTVIWYWSNSNFTLSLFNQVIKFQYYIYYAFLCCAAGNIFHQILHINNLPTPQA